MKKQVFCSDRRLYVLNKRIVYTEAPDHVHTFQKQLKRN